MILAININKIIRASASIEMIKGLTRLILFFGVIMVTTSSFIIRYADQDSYALAFVRVLITSIYSLLLALIIFKSRDKSKKTEKMSLRDAGLIFMAGASLASHFAWWFSSLDYIPISTSLSLTNTAPVWLALISFSLLKTKMNYRQIVAIILVILGTIILFMEGIGFDFSVILIEDTSIGLVLALSSAIGFAIYLLVAKLLLAKYGLWRYFGLVNLSSAITLIFWLFVQNKIYILQNIELWLWGALLALFPGILGHAVYNWSMSKLHQIDVAIATLGEPVLGTVMAWIIFAEVLSPLQSVGLSFLLLAIIISFLSRKIKK